MKKIIAIISLIASSLILAQEPLSQENMRKDSKVLSALPCRLSGSDNAKKASAYIISELKKIDKGKVYVQSFSTPMENVKVCELRTASDTIKLQPFKANGICPSVISLPAGTPVQYLENLSDKNLESVDLKGKIVITPVTETNALATLFRHDAKAVIFIGSPNVTKVNFDDKVSVVTLDIPRFYISEADAAAKNLKNITKGALKSEIIWQRRTGANIFYLFEGEKSKFKYDKPELILLSANYDSFGYVPHDSPAGEGATNCAVLLETARQIAKQKNKRSVLIAFFDAHANYFQGAREFYTALRRAFPERIADPFEVREKYIQEERDFLHKSVEILKNQDKLLKSDTFIADKARERCRIYAKFTFGTYQQLITKTRFKIKAMQNQEHPVEKAEALLDKSLKEQKSWQALLENIREKSPSKEADPALKITIAHCLQNIRLRLDELKNLDAFLRESKTLTQAIKTHIMVAHVAYQFRGGFDKWIIATEKSMRPKLKKEWFDTVFAADKQEAVNFVWDVANSKDFINHIQDSPAESFFAFPFRIPAAKLLTVEDDGHLIGVPGRQLTETEINNIFKQAKGFTPFLKTMLNDELFSSPEQITRERKILIEEYQWGNGEAEGHKVMSTAFGETAPTQLEPGALVYIFPRNSASLQNSYLRFADANACFPYLTLDRNSWGYMKISAGKFDENGKIISINSYMPNGPMASVQRGWTNVGRYAAKSVRGFYTIVSLFKGPGGNIVGNNLPFSEPFKPGTFKILNGLSNSKYKNLHFDMDNKIGIGSYWIEEPYGVKFIYENPKAAEEVALLVNATRKNVFGIGYGPGAGDDLIDSYYDKNLDLNYHMASDLYILNESRLAVLRKKNIIRNDLELIHSNATELYKKYDKENKAGKYTKTLHTANLITVLEQKIYRPIISMTNDMVVAVTILLLMALPFAFAIQSLIFPTYDIYGKIIRFIIIFLLSFATLYLVHPAFSFASMPIVILIAFIIMVLSGMVIWLIGNKFSYEVKKMQGMATAAHTFESKAIGNFGAAISLAISTMRRRPVRTFLTIVTVLLLTYTILSFASFQAEKGINDFYLGGADQNSRLLIRRKVWKNMDEYNLGEFKTYLQENFNVHGRYWKTLELANIEEQDSLQVPIYTKSGSIVTASAVMTIHQLEIEKIPALKNVFNGDLNKFYQGKGIFLSESMMKKSSIKPGDMVRFEGYELKVIGSFDAQKILNIQQIDDSPLLPIDFNITQQALGQFESKGSVGSSNALDDLLNELESLGTEALEAVSPDSLIVAPVALHKKLDLKLKAVVAYPNQNTNIKKAAHDLALMNSAGVYVNNSGERTFYHFGDTVGMGGFSDVIIPLLLGGLIIFSTMLGSIIDREQEIYTFSALGLSPKSIAMLFFVESGIYAIIGGFGGYLLSQVITRVLEVLAAYGLFRAPEMNYSSSTAIYTILMVMATVIISTIYPASQAAKKATADTSSTWKIPEPKGDVCAFNFPFTISEFDISGVICFLNEHFTAYADRTIGEFAIDNIDIFKDDEHNMLAIRADVWLQPFDEGISEHFELTSRPSDIPEVCEIHVSVKRLSGPPSSWRRSNILFMKDLRRQFLLWRTLDDEVMEHYLTVAEETEEKFHFAHQT